MNDSHLDVSKAKFSTADDLSGVDSVRGAGPHTLSDGNVISVEARDGQLAGYAVKDSSGKLLKSYEVSATDAAGGKLCWLCYYPENGLYTCVRVSCVPITLEPV
jgi:hypothetical protein